MHSFDFAGSLSLLFFSCASSCDAGRCSEGSAIPYISGSRVCIAWQTHAFSIELSSRSGSTKTITRKIVLLLKGTRTAALLSSGFVVAGVDGVYGYFDAVTFGTTDVAARSQPEENPKRLCHSHSRQVMQPFVHFGDMPPFGRTHVPTPQFLRNCEEEGDVLHKNKSVYVHTPSSMIPHYPYSQA